MNSYDCHQILMNSMTMNINKNRKIHTAHMTFINNHLSFYQCDILIYHCKFNFNYLNFALLAASFDRYITVSITWLFCTPKYGVLFFWGWGEVTINTQRIGAQYDTCILIVARFGEQERHTAVTIVRQHLGLATHHSMRGSRQRRQLPGII